MVGVADDSGELTYVVGAIMALAAVFGIVKLMYPAGSVRTSEIATLRAIGYQGLPLGVAVPLETAVLALIGALLGSGAAWLLFNGKHVTQILTRSIWRCRHDCSRWPLCGRWRLRCWAVCLRRFVPRCFRSRMR